MHGQTGTQSIALVRPTGIEGYRASVIHGQNNRLLLRGVRSIVISVKVRQTQDENCHLHNKFTRCVLKYSIFHAAEYPIEI